MENPGPEDLRAFKPQWCLYWARGFSPSQYAIWEPYLRRSRFRFLVLVDGKGRIPRQVMDRAADLPNVAFAHSGWSRRQLSRLPSMQGVLYAGHRPQNWGAVAGLPRFAHVFLGHGNSGKRSSFARITTLYDSILLASYSHLDGFRQPVRRRLRPLACAIGAPVVEGVEASAGDGPAPERPRVLYLPTWEGHGPNADYTSIELVLASLQAAPPVCCEEVVLRPHPGTGNVRKELRAVRDAYAGFAQGVPALTKAAAYNRADVAVCDIGGATSEFLFTRKPIVVPWGPHLRRLGLTRQNLRALYPYAHLWDVEEQSLDEAVHAALRDEQLARRRHRAADEVFRGHRSLNEAVRTFDCALSVMPRRHWPVPLRALFEARVLAARVRP